MAPRGSVAVFDVRALLVVDINVLGIGAMREYEFQHLAHQGYATGAIHGTFDKLSTLLNAHPEKVPIVLWDDRCRWREELLPQYKRHRWDTPEQQEFLRSYLAQAKVVQSLLMYLGIPQASCPDFEADDLAGLICRGLNPDWQVTLATTDTDWFQALKSNVVWESATTGDVVTEADLGNANIVKEGPFLSTDHFVRSKALAGDRSDGIAGVRGVGLKTAARILMEHGTIEALWAKHDAGAAIKGVNMQRAAGPEYRGTYQRNMRLVDWRLAPPLRPDFRLDFEQPNMNAFRALCADWGLHSIARAWGPFCLPGQASQAAVDHVRTILVAASSSGESPARQHRRQQHT